MIPTAAPGDTSTRQVRARTLVPIAGFLAYAASVWLVPTPDAGSAVTSPETTGDAAAGARAWRAAGCQACHSILGLGGHTGPDLTNILSRTSPEYVRAIMLAGQPGMPSYFRLDPDHSAAIIDYLAAIDRSARYPSDSWMGARPEHAP